MGKGFDNLKQVWISLILLVVVQSLLPTLASRFALLPTVAPPSGRSFGGSNIEILLHPSSVHLPARKGVPLRPRRLQAILGAHLMTLDAPDWCFLPPFAPKYDLNHGTEAAIVRCDFCLFLFCSSLADNSHCLRAPPAS
jgi:hypothetical protein